MEYLRRLIAEQQNNPNKIIRAVTNPPASTSPAVATNRVELDRQYQAGQLTAKQYRRALDQLEKEEKRAAAESAKRAREAAAQASKANSQPAKSSSTPTRSVSPREATAAPISPAPAAPPVAPEPTARQKEISDVEKRIDEMLRLKAEREKAATNSTAVKADPSNAAPQTKRQRLDALLKQYVDGSVDEADYKAKRAKILTEPD